MLICICIYVYTEYYVYAQKNMHIYTHQKMYVYAHTEQYIYMCICIHIIIRTCTWEYLYVAATKEWLRFASISKPSCRRTIYICTHIPTNTHITTAHDAYIHAHI